MKAHFEDMRETHPHWSLGAWARKLGLKATASLSMVLNGQRLPGPKMTRSLVRYFGFSDQKRERYFLNLIHLHKAKKDPAMKLMLLQQLERENPGGKFTVLSAEQFAAIAQWHHYAVREMTQLSDFSSNPEWIQKKLLFPVTLSEIRRAIQRLIDLKVLKTDSRGRLKTEGGTLDTSSDIASEAIRRFHEQMIENSKACIRAVGVEERELGGVTFSIRKEAVPVAKEKIRKFVQEMLDLLESPKNAEAVYQLNVQFFPLTKPKKEK